MNTQPDGHPTDAQIAAGEELGMDPWEIMRIMDTWERIVDEMLDKEYEERKKRQ